MPTEIIQSKKLEIKPNDNVIKPEEYKIVLKDTSNYFDQMRSMIINEGWTTQDWATLQLLQEMPSAHCFYIVRKSDDLVLGALTVIVTEHIVYGNQSASKYNDLGNSYIMTKGFRAVGLGSKLIRAFLFKLREELKTRPLVGRVVPQVWRAYVNEPFNVKYFYNLYSCRFVDRDDLRSFFPLHQHYNYTVLSVKEILRNKPELFKELIAYDFYVTGQDRKQFLTNFFSIDFVEGVVIIDQDMCIRGLAAIGFTGNIPGQYKLNPVYASNKEDAGLLIHTISNLARHEQASFVIHMREQSAGEWILQKCRETGRHIHLVSSLISATTHTITPKIYKDISKPELIFAPTNSAAHFDG